MAKLRSMHPAPDKLMETFRGTFDGLISFIQQKYIIAIPSAARPILQETPPFLRATTTASMDAPITLQQKARERTSLCEPGQARILRQARKWRA